MVVMLEVSRTRIIITACTTFTSAAVSIISFARFILLTETLFISLFLGRQHHPGIQRATPLVRTKNLDIYQNIMLFTNENRRPNPILYPVKIVSQTLLLCILIQSKLSSSQNELTRITSPTVACSNSVKCSRVRLYL